MSLNFTTDHACLTADQVSDLYKSVGFWSKDDGSTLENIGHLFRSRDCGFFAIDKLSNSLVGMVRVLTDDYATTWISEVCVNPAWQGKGIGKILMGMCMARYKHTAIYLEAFPDSTDFFNKLGIQSKAKLIAHSKAAVRNLS